MNKNNPFYKYLGPEDHLHHQVIQWVKIQYPKLKFHHSPNEGRRSPFERMKFKYLGGDSGFPDLLFPSIFLAIELKIKPNKPTPQQLEWLQYFSTECQYIAEVCYNFDDAVAIIKKQVESKIE